jgi:hypothetical protein
MLILRADGRAKAKVWMSRFPGQEPNWVEAEEIRYNLRTGELQTDNISNLRFNLDRDSKLKGIPNLNAAPSTSPKTKRPGRIP